jgi:hypothetical protein
MSDLAGGGAPEGSAGFIYSFGIHMGIGRGPVNQLRECRVGGKLAWQGTLTASGVVSINQPNLFGGLKKEGGIVGFFHAMFGEPLQVASDALKALCAPTPVPGFRRQLTIHYDGQISAVNPYPKPWSWRVRRSTAGWDGDVLAPELAMIPLYGQVASEGSTSPQALARATIMTTVPRVHGVSMNVDHPPGGPIASVNSVYYAGGGDAVPIPFFNVVYKPDGTADVMAPGKWEGFELTVSFFYSISGGGLASQAYTAVPTTWTNKVRIHVVPPSGVVNGITNVYYNANPDFPATVRNWWDEVMPDGSAWIIIDEYYYGVELICNYLYTPAGSMTMITGSRTIFAADQDIGTPAQVAVTAPNGGRYHSTIDVNTTNSTELMDVDYSPQGVFFEEAGIDPENASIGYINIMRPAYEGQEVAIQFFYEPNLGQSTLTPDANIWAMNPSHMIYECLTNREWGRGKDRSGIDTASFEDAAQQLYEEGFGLCMKWSRKDDIKVFIQNILNHIGASLRHSRSTALLEIKLIRADYIRSGLKLWDTTNGILEISDSNVNTATVIINEVIVKYKDPIYNEIRSVNEQNLASLQSGAFNTRTIEYLGLPIPGLARRVALRDLKAMAQGLRRFKITTDRRASDMLPGDVMRIQNVARGIPDMVVRIGTAHDGTLTDGKCTFDVVQDVFSFPAQGFTLDQPNTWVPPNFTPCIGQHEVFELPYFLINRAMRPADFAMLTDASAYAGTVAERGQPINSLYDIAIRDGAPTVEDIPDEADQLYCGYIP